MKTGRPVKNRTYLAKVIEERGMDRYEFAKALGITRSHIDMILRGDRYPGRKLAIKISKLTGLPLEKILEE